MLMRNTPEPSAHLDTTAHQKNATSTYAYQITCDLCLMANAGNTVPHCATVSAFAIGFKAIQHLSIFHLEHRQVNVRSTASFLPGETVLVGKILAFGVEMLELRIIHCCLGSAQVQCNAMLRCHAG